MEAEIQAMRALLHWGPLRVARLVAEAGEHALILFKTNLVLTQKGPRVIYPGGGSLWFGSAAMDSTNFADFMRERHQQTALVVGPKFYVDIAQDVYEIPGLVLDNRPELLA